jgi:MFS family permease
MYGLRLHRDWTFLAFSTVLARTATLYVMAAVALPEQIDETAIDLGVYFDRQHRWFFAFFLATLLVSVIKDVIVNGHLPDRTNLSFHLVLGIGCVAGMLLRGRRAQGILALGFAAVLVTYVALLFARLR